MNDQRTPDGKTAVPRQLNLKRLLYVGCFIVLGLLLQFLLRAGVETVGISAFGWTHWDRVHGALVVGFQAAADGSTVTERLDRNDDVGSEFGVTIRTISGSSSYTRARIHRDLLDGVPRHVVVLRTTLGDHRIETALRRRVSLEEVLERVQNRFINAVPTEIHGVVNWALEEVGEFLGADRAYILTFDNDARTETMIHEWARPGVEPELGTYDDVSWDLAPAASRRNSDLWVSAVPDVATVLWMPA